MRVLPHRLEQLSLLHSYRNRLKAILTRSAARRFCEFRGLKGLKAYLEPVGDVSHQGGNKGLIFWRGDDSWWPSIPAHTTAADKGYDMVRSGWCLSCTCFHPDLPHASLGPGIFFEVCYFFFCIYRGAITMIPWRGL